MILVKTKLGCSEIQGIGLFADEDIEKGTIVGKNNDIFGIIRLSEEEWQGLGSNLSKESFKQISRYAYKNKTDGLYWLNLDDTRFINHSKEPNIATTGDNDIALKDIRAGEEILIDYSTFYDKEYLKMIMSLV